MGGSFDLNALSGINAASTGLGVISNNLANAQTVGFKGSRTEFADLFSGAQSSSGSGVRVAAITQDFTQGTINGTGRELDMAIDGEGFFVMEDQTGRYDYTYTRNGSFKLDQEGYLTSQDGNRVQGYLLNQTLSTETNAIFGTALSSIDLDELNKLPKSTSEMTYDINLDGEEAHNVDPTSTINYAGLSPVLDPAAPGAPTPAEAAVFNSYVQDDSVGSAMNLGKLINPEANGEFQGFSDYFYPMTIHDSLGGEHTLNANFYKRDVVPEVPGLAQFQYLVNDYQNAFESYDATVTTGGTPSLAQETALETAYSALYGGFDAGLSAPTSLAAIPAANDTAANIYADATDIATAITTEKATLTTDAPTRNTEGEKYTSWIVQYTVTATDAQGNTVYTGHDLDQNSSPAVSNGMAGQIFELRFDTDGKYLGAYQLVNPQTLSDNANLKAAGAPDSDFGNVRATDLGSLTDSGGAAYWEPIGGSPELSFVIDNPLTGATDPLGGLDPSDNQITISLDFESMTQFSGSYNQRGTTQNGYSIGDLVGLQTGLDGIIEARYSNGRSVPVAQLAVANFADKNAMEKLGAQSYAESYASGPVQLGTPQSNGMGTINAGSLEYSNVDVAAELVNMIQTQRTYQASAQVISTSQTLTQTILNL